MSPFQLLFAVFLLVPMVEIYLLIKVGSLIGAGWTVFLVVFTAVLGAWLVRAQGVSTFGRVQAMLNRGELPAVEMFEGLFILVAGALLLTPGFFTDAVGFAFLVPPLRRLAITAMLRRGIIHTGGPGGRHGRGPRGPRSQGPRTLEGEYRELDD
jgi:UPF0716 protein FxsA